jgi:metal-responsive CopG/Arc/MetJ family transcriptional regulator
MVLNASMKTKMTVSLDTQLVQFLGRYQSKHQIKTRSETLEVAVSELRRAHLRSEYAAAAQDLEYLADTRAWIN